MTKKSTKSALFTSAISLLLCFSMLLGTTFAWFTDSVTSANNIIKSGTLKVEMYYADGTNNPSSTTWIDASEGPIFTCENWEPGYVDVKHIKISNVGSLAFKYKVNIIPDGEEFSNLSDVIDVYFIDPAKQITGRAALVDEYRVGTLTELMNGMPENASGTLEKDESDMVTIALKMQESAGNKYQGLSLGNFSVKLLATQLESEEDSFGTDYDAEAKYDELILAKTRRISKTTTISNPDGIQVLGENLLIDTSGSRMGADLSQINLDTAYQFEPAISAEEVEESEYADWHADFVVYADKDVPADSIVLAGYYDAWCSLNNDKWVALPNEGLPVSANEEVRLVDGMGNGSITVSYREICQYGNDGVGFLCGAMALDKEALKGTTLTVELRIYEATGASRNTETGKYTPVGKYTYTF